MRQGTICAYQTRSLMFQSFMFTFSLAEAKINIRQRRLGIAQPFLVKSLKSSNALPTQVFSDSTTQ